MHNKQTHEEIKKIEKDLRKITRRIREGKDKHPGRVVGELLTKMDKNNISLLQVNYYPQKNLRIMVKYKNAEHSISLGEFPIELDNYQKALIRILAKINKDLNELGNTPYVPEVHLSEYESTKHHPKLFWGNANENYETYKHEIEETYEGQLYAKLLRVTA